MARGVRVSFVLVGGIPEGALVSNTVVVRDYGCKIPIDLADTESLICLMPILYGLEVEPPRPEGSYFRPPVLCRALPAGTFPAPMVLTCAPAATAAAEQSILSTESAWQGMA